MPHDATSNPEDVLRFIEVFGLAARQTGCLARRLQGKVGLNAKAGHHTPESAALTPVDLAAQDVLLLALCDAFPRAAMDAEEKTESAHFFRREERDAPVIVVDPIDGTLNYGEGLPDYAVMGAWIETGFYRAAMVHFPHSGDLFWAREGSGCFVKKPGRETALASIGALPARVLVTSAVPDDWCADLQEAGFEVSVSRCSAVDATAPVTGRAAAAITLGRPDRRRAIGFLPTLEAGGVVWTGDRWWAGEDPAGLTAERGVTVVADSRDTVARLGQALRRHLKTVIGQ